MPHSHVLYFRAMSGSNILYMRSGVSKEMSCFRLPLSGRWRLLLKVPNVTSMCTTVWNTKSAGKRRTKCGYFSLAVTCPNEKKTRNKEGGQESSRKLPKKQKITLIIFSSLLNIHSFKYSGNPGPRRKQGNWRSWPRRSGVNFQPCKCGAISAPFHWKG